ncbi:MAG: ParA family protein [Sulfobacillus thermotolerans]|nr:ParA family protein [Sulfobacillus thermotolerans]
MMLVVHNQKGGVGKTTTSVNLAACLAAAQVHVLLIDGDLQANATDEFACPLEPRVARWIRDDVFMPVQARENLDVLSSSPDEEWWWDVATDQVQRRVDNIRSRYDIIIVDTAPSRSPWVTSLLQVADAILVPVDLAYHAVAGVDHLLKFVPTHRLIGFVPVRFDRRTRQSALMLEALSASTGNLVAPAIRTSIEVDRAAQSGKPLVEYAPHSTAAQDYIALAEWVVTRLVAQAG